MDSGSSFTAKAGRGREWRASDFSRLDAILTTFSSEMIGVLALETRGKTQDHKATAEKVFCRFTGEQVELASVDSLFELYIRPFFNNGCAELSLPAIDSAGTRTVSALRARVELIRLVWDWHEIRAPPTGTGTHLQSSTSPLALRQLASDSALFPTEQVEEESSPASPVTAMPPAASFPRTLVPPTSAQNPPRETAEHENFWYLEQETFRKKLGYHGSDLDDKKRKKLIQEVRDMMNAFPSMRLIYGKRPSAAQTRSTLNPQHVSDMTTAPASAPRTRSAEDAAAKGSTSLAAAKSRIYNFSGLEKKRCEQPTDAAGEPIAKTSRGAKGGRAARLLGLQEEAAATAQSMLECQEEMIEINKRRNDLLEKWIETTSAHRDDEEVVRRLNATDSTIALLQTTLVGQVKVIDDLHHKVESAMTTMSSLQTVVEKIPGSVHQTVAESNIALEQRLLAVLLPALRQHKDG